MSLVASYESYSNSSWFNSEFFEKDDYKKANNKVAENVRYRESNPFSLDSRNYTGSRTYGSARLSLIQAIKQINIDVAEYQRAIGKMDLDSLTNTCDISTLASVGYEPSSKILDEYSKALKRTNGGTLRSFLLRANIPQSIIKDQIRAAVLGAIEAIMFGFSHKTGNTLHPTRVDPVQFQQLIADRLGNLAGDEAMAISKIVFEEILTRNIKTKLVVNGGAISVSAYGELLAYPMTRFGARTLLQMHWKKPESEMCRLQK